MKVRALVGAAALMAAMVSGVAPSDAGIAAVTVDPGGDLVDGQEVTVTASSVPDTGGVSTPAGPQFGPRVYQCDASVVSLFQSTLVDAEVPAFVDAFDVRCTALSEPNLSVPSNALVETVNVQRVITTGDNTPISSESATIDCEVTACAILVAAASGNHNGNVGTVSLDYFEIAPISIVRPTISPGGAAIIEGDTGSAIVQVPVRLSAPLSEEITVDYATIDDPESPMVASAGSDYVATSGTVTFEPGDTIEYVDVEVLGDTLYEPPLLYGEWGIVSFFDPSANAVLDDVFFGAGVFVILDDESQPTITPGAVVAEPEGDAGSAVFQLPVTLSGPSAEEVSIDYSTRADTDAGYAQQGIDYTATSGTLTFAPGETEAFVDIEVFGDLSDERPLYQLPPGIVDVTKAGEWIRVDFANPVNGDLDTVTFDGVGVMIILDDDGLGFPFDVEP